MGSRIANILVLLVLFSSMIFAAQQENTTNSTSSTQDKFPSKGELELRQLILFVVVIIYVFAAGRIADFLKARGTRISKKEVLLAPFLFMMLSALGVLLYFSTPYWLPPQDTIVTKAVYLIAVPLAIATGLGAFVLYSFFHGRLNVLDSLDLSARIVFAPVFDGLKGYWTMINVIFVLGIIATISFYSSGGNFSLITLDFLLLSLLVASYFIYHAVVGVGNENKASNFVTALILVAPSIMRLYFKELVCRGFSMIPFGLFSACPLDMMGDEVTLAISVIATLIILIPIIPFAYAIMVNLLRFMVVVEVMAGRGSKRLQG